MKKKLTKSKTNVVLTGTLAGIAEYFNIDPTIVRVIYVFLSLTTLGAPIILYIALALLIPTDYSNKSSNYGHTNKYYQKNNYKQSSSRPRKEAEKVEEDDWSDF